MNLYHTIKRENLSGIKEHGLRLSKSKFWVGKGGCIYLSEQPFRPEGKIILLVHTDGLEITRISDWEYVCWEDIQPERITILGNGWVKCGLCGARHLAGFAQPIMIPCECHKCHQMSCYFEQKQKGESDGK